MTAVLAFYFAVNVRARVLFKVWKPGRGRNCFLSRVRGTGRSYACSGRACRVASEQLSCRYLSGCVSACRAGGVTPSLWAWGSWPSLFPLR